MILRVKDDKGNWISIPAIQGEQGEKGDKGDTGESYILTSADKEEIAALVISALDNGEEVRY